jgi:protocatechuate 3,4-dioxygenase beta subunit
LTRREVLVLLGGAGAAAVVGTGFTRLNLSQSTGTAAPAATEMVAPTCVVRPEMTEGPYFVDEMLNRSDIRIEPSDGSVKAGTILRLIFNLSAVSADACTPLEGAQVDVWHCDAAGMYSDVQDPGFSTAGQKWLRGYQISDATGKAEFTTIYPGWYSGRAVHIHFKIRTDPESDSGYEFTSQLFFDDALSDVVFTDQPYASRGATRSTLNANDSIYRNGGDQLLLQPVKEDDGSYTATFDIGLDLSDAAVGASDSASMGGGRGAPGGALPGRNPDAMPTPTPAST